jgi:hypothetical protein
VTQSLHQRWAEEGQDKESTPKHDVTECLQDKKPSTQFQKSIVGTGSRAIGEVVNDDAQ